MPNIKSAIKRVKVIETKTKENAIVRTSYKTACKNFEKEVVNGNREQAEALFRTATKAIDKAAGKGVIKANTASRKKSNLAKLLNKMK